MRKRIVCGLMLCLLGILLCGCTDTVFLPDAGYDYLAAGDSGILLGYPMTRSGENDCCLTGDDEIPASFYYDAQRMEYSRIVPKKKKLLCGGVGIDAYCAVKNGECAYFSAAITAADGAYTVYGGSADGYAVAARADGGIFLCAENKDIRLAENGSVLDVSGEGYVLYTDMQDGVTDLYLFGNGETTLVRTAREITDGWCAAVWQDDEWRTAAVFCADGQWMVFAGTDDAVSACPMETGEETVYVRHTVFAMVGNSTSFRLSDIRDGAVWEMDMGGLYRFDADTVTAVLPVSADGMFVYYYDNDFIYRLNLTDGTLDLAYNEAPLIHNVCVLTSMTPVTDEVILLSQAPEEATEYVPYMSCSVFEDELPVIKEDEKIDLDIRTEDT